jgi:hypothetical protein
MVKRIGYFSDDATEVQRAIFTQARTLKDCRKWDHTLLGLKSGCGGSAHFAPNQVLQRTARGENCPPAAGFTAALATAAFMVQYLSN